MNEIVYVKEHGVLGVVVYNYADGTKRVFYFLDGLSYEVELYPEDFDVRIGGIE